MTYTLEAIRANCAEVGDCLEWQGHFTSNGYPRIHDAELDRYVGVRNVVYALGHGLPLHAPITTEEHGKVKPALMRMRCGNRRCVSLEHMRAMTHAQVGQAAAAMGNFSTPQRIAAVTSGIRKVRKTKITMEIAREIRASEGTCRDQAARYGVSASFVAKVKRGDLWRETVAVSSVFALGATR